MTKKRTTTKKKPTHTAHEKTAHKVTHAHHKTHKPKFKVDDEVNSETWNKVFVIVAAILIIGILAGVGNLVQNIDSQDKMTRSTQPAIKAVNYQEPEGGIVALNTQDKIYAINNIVMEKFSYRGENKQADYDSTTGKWMVQFEAIGREGQTAIIETTIDDKTLKPEKVAFLLPVPSVETPVVEKVKDAFGNIVVTNQKTLLEGNKPLVLMFSASWCPHCRWERPVLVKASEKFGIWNGIDQGKLDESLAVIEQTLDTTTTADRLAQIDFKTEGAEFTSDHLVLKIIETDLHPDNEYNTVFKDYNPSGGVPVLVYGGKYYQLGSGENLGSDKEEQYLTAVFCDLTNNAIDECQEPEIQNLMGQLN